MLLFLIFFLSSSSDWLFSLLETSSSMCSEYLDTLNHYHFDQVDKFNDFIVMKIHWFKHFMINFIRKVFVSPQKIPIGSWKFCVKWMNDSPVQKTQRKFSNGKFNFSQKYSFDLQKNRLSFINWSIKLIIFVQYVQNDHQKHHHSIKRKCAVLRLICASKKTKYDSAQFKETNRKIFCLLVCFVFDEKFGKMRN